MYQFEVSQRLCEFMDHFAEYEDIGGPESGPKVVISGYSGPEWALELYSAATDPDQYMFDVVYSNNFYSPFPTN